ncbi:MAG: peptidase M20 [Candidatus Cloacimonadota bacterium]|nr:MAG: peptidase M20 [Candidatus Cloacimonadota bacterium]PIE78598.1 MAG: peptidase M20 [Candidatus Delongbacteria bacterium]
MKMDKIINLRHTLHKNAELSHNEKETSKILKEYLIPLKPDYLEDVGYGFFIVFDSKKEGPVSMFRSDIDALPIEESNDFEYRSKNINRAHLCGHDGHMAIAVYLAEKISKNKPQRGKTIILFQPAEEVGEGAKQVLESEKFLSLNPNYVFGLHNIPGYRKSSIIIKKGSFASASRGMVIKLFGKQSHAGEPEKGITPVFAVERIIGGFRKEIERKDYYRDFHNLTIVHINIGEAAFGTSPGYGEVLVTLRTALNSDMEKLVDRCENIIRSICEEEKLKFEIDYKEIFPATINDDYCVDMVKEVAKSSNLETIEIDTPFKWSEDFSYFTNRYKGSFFGLGSGVDTPNLHNQCYNFPDDIIESGGEIFFNLYEKIHR